jgi:hypothetical protein
MSETSNGASSSRASLIRRIATLAREFEAGSGPLGHIEPPAETFLIQGEAEFRISVTDALEPLVMSIKENLKATSACEPFRYFHVALDEFIAFADLLTPARRVMSLLTDSPLRLLLLDTNNQLAHVTGSTVVGSSLRTTTGEKRLCEPHLVISHDIQLIQEDTYNHYRAFLQGEKQLTHDQMFGLMSCMGRPLWNDKNYQAGKNDPSVAGINLKHIVRKMGCKGLQDDKDEILALAMSRLPLHAVGFQGQYFRARRPGWPLVMDARLIEMLVAFLLSGLSNVKSFTQTQITKHLRCITGFDCDGDIVYTNTPSEPIMRCAPQSFRWREV